MVSWKDEDWTRFQESSDPPLKDWQIAKLVSAVDSVREKAETGFNDEVKSANIGYVNVRNVTLEKVEIKKDLLEFLGEFEVDEDAFDYATMYEEAKKNVDKQGFIIPGSLTKAYYRQKLAILNSKSVVSKDVEEVKRKADEARSRIRETPSSIRHKTNPNRPKSIDDAAESVLADLRVGRA